MMMALFEASGSSRLTFGDNLWFENACVGEIGRPLVDILHRFVLQYPAHATDPGRDRADVLACQIVGKSGSIHPEKRRQG